MAIYKKYSECTVGELVAEDYRRAGVFSKYGIDFCCGGKRSLQEACRRKNVSSEVLITELTKLDEKTETSDERFNEWEPDVLAEYIVKTHHRYVREKIPEISTYSGKVARVHGDRHPEVIEIATIFNRLAEELSSHLEKEENILFPYIRHMVLAKINGTHPNQPFFGTVENPIQMMEKEHDDAGREMARIEELSNAYNAPDDACTTFRILYQNLNAFDEDLHKHIHLENNILFPKVLQL